MTAQELIEHLKALKSPSQQQKLLLLLAEKTELNRDEKRKFDALVKAELAAYKAAIARSKVTAILRTEERAAAEAARKARNHRLIQMGVLVEMAGMDGWSKGEILGGLLAMAKNPAQRHDWKRAGDALLAEKEAPRANASGTRRP